SSLDIQSRMLYNLLAFCFVSHLNNTPKPDSSQEPGFVFRGCLFMRQPLVLRSSHEKCVNQREKTTKNVFFLP
ncbi:MAG: hypothetical protein U0K16_02375, partial [Evtepia sp.]|nr:hypothetical protein [Evtepia sp.]